MKKKIIKNIFILIILFIILITIFFIYYRFISEPDEHDDNGVDDDLIFLKTLDKTIVTNNEEIFFLRGINFGGWLAWESSGLGFPDLAEHMIKKELKMRMGKNDTDLFFSLIKENLITEIDFKNVKEIGVNFVRLPVHYKYFNSENISYVDQAVTWAKNHGLYILLDMHVTPGSQNTYSHSDNDGVARLWINQEYQEEFIDIWEYIADYYRNESVILGYELINEPVYTDDKKISSLYEKTIEAVRKIDDKHMFFLNDNHNDQDFSVFNPLSLDENTVYVFHTYAKLDSLTKTVDNYKFFQNKYNVPIICDEYGGFNLISYFEEQKIPHAPWHYKSRGKNTPFYYEPDDHPWRLWMENISDDVKEKNDTIKNEMLTIINNTNRLTVDCRQDLIELIIVKKIPSESDFNNLIDKYPAQSRIINQINQESKEIINDATLDMIAESFKNMSNKEKNNLMSSLQTKNYKQGIMSFP